MLIRYALLVCWVYLIANTDSRAASCDSEYRRPDSTIHDDAERGVDLINVSTIPQDHLQFGVCSIAIIFQKHVVPAPKLEEHRAAQKLVRPRSWDTRGSHISPVANDYETKCDVDSIDVHGIPKDRLLLKMWTESKLAHFFKGHESIAPKLDLQGAAKELEVNEKFDYVYGRVIKTDIWQNCLNPRYYDRDNGAGALKKVVESLRQEFPTPADQHDIL